MGAVLVSGLDMKTTLQYSNISVVTAAKTVEKNVVLDVSHYPARMFIEDVSF
jgi:hypothetical protein